MLNGLKVTKTVFLDVTEGGQPLGRIEIGLFGALGLRAVHFSTGSCGLLTCRGMLGSEHLLERD